MLRSHTKKQYLKTLIVAILVVFSTSVLAANFDSARIMPGEKVSIYRGDRQVGELTAEAPFPDGALLACDGECAVRMDDFLLVGADKSLFSVTTEANSRELQVRNGTVYFALSKMSRSLVFVTPKGAVTVQQLILNAAADGGLLKGYVEVSGESSEIGVIEGGSVLVSTAAGETTIPSGNKIVIAQTDEGQVPGAQDAASDDRRGGAGWIPLVVGGTLAGAAPIALSLAIDDSDGGGGGTVSPASP
jgi:hypothetical protein